MEDALVWFLSSFYSLDPAQRVFQILKQHKTFAREWFLATAECDFTERERSSADWLLFFLRVNLKKQNKKRPYLIFSVKGFSRSGRVEPWFHGEALPGCRHFFALVNDQSFEMFWWISYANLAITGRYVAACFLSLSPTHGCMFLAYSHLWRRLSRFGDASFFSPMRSFLCLKCYFRLQEFNCYAPYWNKHFLTM